MIGGDVSFTHRIGTSMANSRITLTGRASGKKIETFVMLDKGENHFFEDSSRGLFHYHRQLHCARKIGSKCVGGIDVQLIERNAIEWDHSSPRASPNLQKFGGWFPHAFYRIEDSYQHYRFFGFESDVM